MRCDVSMESWKSRRASVGILESLNKSFVGLCIWIVEMIVHRTHHAFRAFKTEWFEDGVICGCVHINWDLFVKPGGLTCFKGIRHGSSPPTYNHCVGFCWQDSS